MENQNQQQNQEQSQNQEMSRHVEDIVAAIGGKADAATIEKELQNFVSVYRISLDAAKRGILLEAMSATTLMLAGADILVMRHPEAITRVRGMIGELLQ